MHGTAMVGWAEARRLGHDWVGDVHALIELARLDGPAGDVLRQAGLLPDLVSAELERALNELDPPVERRAVGSPAWNPQSYRLHGRAEGLALAQGANEVTPEHVLVALLWDADGMAAGLLHRLGVDRSKLARALAARGVTVPPGEPRPLDVRPTKRLDVPYEHVMKIARSLPDRLPADARLGFNVHHEAKRAWICVDEDVDAELLVAEILAG